MESFLIKNAQLVTGEIFDIFIENGIIKKVAQSITATGRETVIDIPEGTYVSSGWIDIHTHCFEKFELYADDADEIGYKTGVTTVIDAGTSGADNMTEFHEIAQTKQTRVKAFMNIAETGIYAQHELADMALLDVEKCKAMYKKYPEFLVGIKARMSKTVIGANGIQPLVVAKEVAGELGLPLMVHIGSNPPTLEEILAEMRPKDIVTHIFNPKPNGILDETGTVRDFVFAAHARGLYFDLGHGTDSFGFSTYEKSTAQGLKFDTISSDIYSRNRINGPVYSLATTMNKVFMQGLPLADIIAKVTVDAAKVVGLTKFGQIAEGFYGDITCFTLEERATELVDSTGAKRIAEQIIVPTAVIVQNKYIEITGKVEE